MPDSRPDMRQRALFVTSNAACRRNKMHLAELSVDIPRTTMAAATEHRVRWASRCHPPNVESGTGKYCTLLLASWTSLAYLVTYAAQLAIKMFKVFCTASRIRAWLSRWKIAMSNMSVPPVLPRARLSGLSLCLPRSLFAAIGCRAAVARPRANSRSCASCLLIP